MAIAPLSILLIQSAGAGEIPETNSVGAGLADNPSNRQTIFPQNPPLLSEFDRPATTVKEWLAQTDLTDAVQVTKVQINRTETGLEIILETEGGRALQIDTQQFTADGNTLIANISNAVLKLAEGNEFSTNNPTADISRISINQIDNNRIQISVVGTARIPTNVTLRTGELAYSLQPMGETANVEIVVIGTPRSAYIVPNTTTGTRTDTPLRDIPQSIQAIPQQVIREQQATDLRDVLSNLSGVTPSGSASNSVTDFTIRGFQDAPILRDGFRQNPSNRGVPQLADLERVEVLRGPASILYGEVQPGGVINLVSKQPLTEPFYEAELQIGNRQLIRPRIDISGPLTADRSLLYRLNLAYESSEPFQDFEQGFERFLIAPVVTWKPSDREGANTSTVVF